VLNSANIVLHMKLPLAWWIFVFAKYRLIRTWNTVCVNCLRFITCDIDSHSTTHCMPALTISCSEVWILYGSWYHGKIFITCCLFRGLFYGTGRNLSKIEPIYREFSWRDGEMPRNASFKVVDVRREILSRNLSNVILECYSWDILLGL
jgi:hypothetical protein